MSNLKSKKPGGDQPPREVVKRMSDKKFARIEGTFTKNLRNFNSAIDKMSEVEQVIHSRQVIIPPKDEKSQPTIINLTPAEIQGYRKKLADLKLEKKLTKQKLSVSGKVYQRTCRTNAASVRARISTINKKASQAREAGRKVDDLSDNVLKLIQKLKGSDKRYGMLSHAAKNDGRQFHSDLNKIVREKLSDDFTLLSASPTVRTTVYNKVREYFGWKKKQ